MRVPGMGIRRARSVLAGLGLIAGLVASTSIAEAAARPAAAPELAAAAGLGELSLVGVVVDCGMPRQRATRVRWAVGNPTTTNAWLVSVRNSHPGIDGQSTLTTQITFKPGSSMSQGRRFDAGGPSTEMEVDYVFLDAGGNTISATLTVKARIDLTLACGSGSGAAAVAADRKPLTPGQLAAPGAAVGPVAALPGQEAGQSPAAPASDPAAGQAPDAGLIPPIEDTPGSAVGQPAGAGPAAPPGPGPNSGQAAGAGAPQPETAARAAVPAAEQSTGIGGLSITGPGMMLIGAGTVLLVGLVLTGRSR